MRRLSEAFLHILSVSTLSAFFSGISVPGVLPHSAWSEQRDDSLRRFFFILSVSTLSAFSCGIVFSGCMLSL